MIGVNWGSPDAASGRTLRAFLRRDRSNPCRFAPTSLKPGPTEFGGSMSGILMILAFVVVMAALNLYEFGRLD